MGNKNYYKLAKSKKNDPSSRVLLLYLDVAGQKFQGSLEHGISSAELHVKECLCIRGTFEVAESPEKVQVLTTDWKEIGRCVSGRSVECTSSTVLCIHFFKKLTGSSKDVWGDSSEKKDEERGK